MIVIWIILSVLLMVLILYTMGQSSSPRMIEIGAPVMGINYKITDRELNIVHWFCYEDKKLMKDLLRSYRYGACDIDMQVLHIDEGGGIERIG